MTRDEVIAMAREASQLDGTTRQGKSIVLYAAKSAKFRERFAELVAAKEREACAKLCEEHPDGLNMMGGAFVTCAAAIRARGNA